VLKGVNAPISSVIGSMIALLAVQNPYWHSRKLEYEPIAELIRRAWEGRLPIYSDRTGSILMCKRRPWN
jgi:hypothetical protein